MSDFLTWGGILSYLLNNLLQLEEVHFHLNHDDHIPNHLWTEENTRLISDSFESDIFLCQLQKKIICYMN